MKRHAQQGIALVITLVMLSVVTFMAITFLAVSRRQRAAVTVSEDQATARLMADQAIARAQAEILSRAMAATNLLAYDMLVSTNLTNPEGFDPSQPLDQFNPFNVNYDRVQGSGAPLSEQQRLRVIANLMVDPRAPVFVQTNADPRAPLDFRFFIDLNRNGRFETNGWLPVLDAAERPIFVTETNGLQTVLSNFFVGDPEWIGVLDEPGRPHSSSNRFVGRYAYLVLPAGKSLDLNFIHNNARRHGLGGIGYYRNQGVGSWELNLAAFFRDLNTNAWTAYDYRGLNAAPITDSFLDAYGFLNFRYGGSYSSLASAADLFGTRGLRVFRSDRIDAYTDGPAFRLDPLTADNDLPNRPWPGSDNPFHYWELNDLFRTNRAPLAWLARFTNAQQRLDSYDRYTFYRMLAQIGTDSTPVASRKVNINFDNRPPKGTTNLAEWTPVDFFLTTAERLFEAARVTNWVQNASGEAVLTYLIGDTVVRSNFSVTNIMLWPTNEYTPTIHRLLQVAVNLYDATTNRALTPYPYLPTVLKPMFRVEGTNLFVAGYREVTNAAFLDRMVIRDVRVPSDRAALAAEPDGVVYDVPFLIGAKKGFPNFNEFSMINVAQVSRKVEVVKRTEADRRPVMTNLVYLLSVSNQFGIEFWNSYTNAYPRPLRLRTAGDVRLILTNNVQPGTPGIILQARRIPYHRDETIPRWNGRQFRLPVFTNIVFVPESTFVPYPPQLVPGDTNLVYTRGLGFYVPEWGLVISNRFYCALVDETTGRLVDFVAFGNMHTGINITRALAGRAAQSGAGVQAGGNVLDRLWSTNRIGGSSTFWPTEGVLEQMEISLGDIPVSDRIWRSYNRASGPGSRDKQKAIDLFREFCGLTPLVYNTPRLRSRLRAELRGRIAVQAPFAPVRKFYQEASWQVNDPLVHYMMADLLDPRSRPDDPNRTNAIRFVSPPTVLLTNSNLGRLNNRYRPWGGNPNQSYDVLARNPAFKDPGVRSSDDWDFPGGKFPSVGWIGRVHRGTPWQTIYLKSAVANTNLWFLWAGSRGTHPTNDWALVDVFTTAYNENASRGLLSVNQTNLAAWSAVLSGVSVLTNTTPGYIYTTNSQPGWQEMLIEPNSPQLWQIVEGLNRTRKAELRRPAQSIPVFNRMGRVLATPELTLRSPYINTNNLLNDAILERIPQQILSLLKEDEPRFTVYAFGQALRPAPESVYIGPGPFNRMCTNYQVTGEYMSKAVIHLEGPPERPRAVIDDYTEIFPE